MRWVLRAALIGFALGIAVIADMLRPGATLLPVQLELALPAVVAFATFAPVLWTINDQQLGRIPWQRTKPVVMALPRALWLVMGVLFLATMLNLSLTFVDGGQDPEALTRAFAGNVAWINAATAALACGILRLRAQPAL